MEATDWRAKLLPESREKIVVKIIDTLKKCVPSSERNDLHGIKKLAESFEEKIYAAAKDENDYLMRISVKMTNVRERSFRTVASNSSQLRPSCSGETLEFHGIQSQGISQNSVGKSAGQGMYSDLSPNNLRQSQGRQHSLVVTQQTTSSLRSYCRILISCNDNPSI